MSPPPLSHHYVHIAVRSTLIVMVGLWTALRHGVWGCGMGVGVPRGLGGALVGRV
jgi:hypothetical protein